MHPYNQWRKESDSLVRGTDPDPHQNVTDPQLWLLHHRAHIHKEYHSVCARVGIGAPHPSIPPASVPLPPEPNGWVRGWEGVLHLFISIVPSPRAQLVSWVRNMGSGTGYDHLDVSNFIPEHRQLRLVRFVVECLNSLTALIWYFTYWAFFRARRRNGWKFSEEWKYLVFTFTPGLLHYTVWHLHIILGFFCVWHSFENNFCVLNWLVNAVDLSSLFNSRHPNKKSYLKHPKLPI